MDLVFGTLVSNEFKNCIQHGKLLLNSYVPRDTHTYLIESISQCLHVKTTLARRCVSFYETIEASSKLCIRFLSNLCKNDLNTWFLAEIYFPLQMIVL